MNEIEELIKKYEKDIVNLTKSMGFSSPLNETRKRELLTCLEFGITTLQKVKHKPVEVPPCADKVIKEGITLGASKVEIVGNAESYSSVRPDDEFSKWFKGNEDLFFKAVANGYTVTKEPSWVVAVEGEEAFSGFLRLDGQGETMKVTFNNSTSVKFVNEAKAEAVALLIGGEVVPVEEEAE